MKCQEKSHLLRSIFVRPSSGKDFAANAVILLDGVFAAARFAHAVAARERPEPLATPEAGSEVGLGLVEGELAVVDRRLLQGWASFSMDVRNALACLTITICISE